MAKLTGALANAGASLIPSPTIPNYPVPRNEFVDGGKLFLGQEIGAHFVNTRLRRDRAGGGRVVAGQHNGAHALAVQFPDRLDARIPQRVGNREDSQRDARLRYENSFLWHDCLYCYHPPVIVVPR